MSKKRKRVPATAPDATRLLDAGHAVLGAFRRSHIYGQESDDHHMVGLLEAALQVWRATTRSSFELTATSSQRS